MRFELINGRHSNKTANFVKGDIVEAATDLTKTFKNKFRRRTDLEGKGAKPIALLNAKNKRPAPAAPIERVELDEEDELEQPEEQIASPHLGDEDPAPAAKTSEVKSKLGTNVTSEFPDAASNEFVVFKDNKGKFHVAEPDEPNEAANPSGLTKAEVTAFIKRMTK